MQASQPQSPVWHGTTILTVRKGGKVVIGGDGQVSIGQTVIKSNAKKVRKLGKGDVIGGFAGATADAFTLFERLESKLEQYPGQLTRAAVELAKDWRTDRYLRRLEAMMIVADKDVSLVLTGTGDVLEPEAGVMAIGSGGNYALAAARALVDSDKDAEAIVRRALDIAADICVYTNRNVTIETLARRLIDGAGLRLPPDDSRRSAADPALAGEPHVAEWWGDPAEQYRAGQRRSRSSGHGPIHRVRLDRMPFGYIQCYDLSTWNTGFGPQPEGTRGIDQFIGEPDMIGRGHGSALHPQLRRRLLRAGHAARRHRSRPGQCPRGARL